MLVPPIEKEPGFQLPANRTFWKLLGPVKVNERVKDESDVNERGEHGIEFFKARENPPESFESAEEPLDFIASFKELEVVFPLVEAISLGRHHWLELHVEDHLSGFVTLIVKKELHLKQSLYEILQVLSVVPFEQVPLHEVLANHLTATNLNGDHNQLSLW